MIEINPNKFKLPPYPHQMQGVRDLLRHPIYGLFWQMRLGKTKVVLDTANLLFEDHSLDVLLVVCPAQVKDVWLDKDLGEIEAHSTHADRVVLDYDADTFSLLEEGGLTWNSGFPTYIVTSLEYLRQQDRHADFPKVEVLRKALEGKRVWLVYDEGSALGTHDSLQVRSVRLLARSKFTKRKTMLDGTPEGNGPMCFYPKFNLLDPLILGFQNFWHFRARHAKTVTIQLDYPAGTTEEQKKFMPKPRSFKKVVGYQNLEELTRKTAPYVSRLERKDVAGMPAKLSSFFTVALEEKTWKVYKQLRDELLAELETGEKQFLTNSAVKVMRLAQVCAGFLGGFDDQELLAKKTVELSQETADGLVQWLKRRLHEEADFKCVIWCRWQPEILRLNALLQKVPGLSSGFVYSGGRVNEDYLHPRSEFKGSFALVAQPQAAQYGRNYSKADTEIWLSSDYNRVTREQASARIEAAGSSAKLSVDVLVTGPRGQKTVVHDIIQSLREKTDLAQRTTDQWKKILKEE